MNNLSLIRPLQTFTDLITIWMSDDSFMELESEEGNKSPQQSAACQKVPLHLIANLARDKTE